eukprot:scaffold9668_cov35-Tisochrysis_lutea.AAC.6
MPRDFSNKTTFPKFASEQDGRDAKVWQASRHRSDARMKHVPFERVARGYMQTRCRADSTFQAQYDRRGRSADLPPPVMWGKQKESPCPFASCRPIEGPGRKHCSLRYLDARRGAACQSVSRRRRAQATAQAGRSIGTGMLHGAP